MQISPASTHSLSLEIHLFGSFIHHYRKEYWNMWEYKGFFFLKLIMTAVIVKIMIMIK